MTIDIMMPFWGRTDHFQLAVQSILDQDDPDLRLVVIDDRNPDPAAAEWVQELTDPRVEYLLNPTNLGPGANFQRAVDLSRAELVVVMGCDDVMRTDYVRRVKHLAREFPEAAIIETGVGVVDGEGQPCLPLADRVKRHYQPKIAEPVVLSGEELAVSLLRGNWLYFPSLCWRRPELVAHGFRPDRDVVQDLTLILEIVYDGGSLVFDPHVAFDYRRHRTSVSWKAGPDGTRFVEERRLFADVAAWSGARGWRRAARSARQHSSSRLNAVSQLPAAVRGGDLRGAVSLVRHGFGGLDPRVDDDPR